MQRSRTTDATTEDVTRRAVLSRGVGAAVGAVGFATFGGQAAAWKRFDVDFKSCREVWFVVGDDLEYDPPARVHVVVAVGGRVECRLLAFTEDLATTVPAQYGDSPLVKFEVRPWEEILGVLPYNRPIGDGPKFSRPRCVMRNDECRSTSGPADVSHASCVRTARAEAWDGEVRECWFDPIDGARTTGRFRKLAAGDAAPGDGFGRSVATNLGGDVVLVGAPGTDEAGTDSGVAHVFRREDGEWTRMARFASDAAEADDRFGTAVALDADGDVALVGTRTVTPAGGNFASVFTFDGYEWTETALLRGEPDAPELAFSGFGHSVALDDAGETAVVGAPFSTTPAFDAGVAVVFEREGDSWEQRAVVRHAQGDDNHFGASAGVSAAGDAAVVGGPVPREGFGTTSGYASVVPRGGGAWEPTVRLSAEAGQPTDMLGTSVAADAALETVVAGDPADDVGVTPDRGSATVFRFADGEWSEVATLLADDGAGLDEFGSAVALDDAGDTALVGAPQENNDRGIDAGAAHRFALDGGEWRQVEKLVAVDGNPNDEFGTSVALADYGETAVVGAPRADGAASRSGAVYVVDLA